MSVILALKRLIEKDLEFKTNLSYLVETLSAENKTKQGLTIYINSRALKSFTPNLYPKHHTSK